MTNARWTQKNGGMFLRRRDRHGSFGLDKVEAGSHPIDNEAEKGLPRLFYVFLARVVTKNEDEGVDEELQLKIKRQLS